MSDVFATFFALERRQTVEKQYSASVARVVTVGLIGLGAGIINGLLGAAGGILLIYTLPFFLKEKMPLPVPFYHGLTPPMEGRDRMATSLAVMLPVTVVSFISYWLSGVSPDLSILSWLAFPAALGGLCGAWLLGRIRADSLRKMFAVIVIVSGFRMLM